MARASGFVKVLQVNQGWLVILIIDKKPRFGWESCLHLWNQVNSFLHASVFLSVTWIELIFEVSDDIKYDLQVTYTLDQWLSTLTLY